MARARRDKRKKAVRTAAARRQEEPGQKKESGEKEAEPARPGRGRGMLTRLAGILSAVLVTAGGVVLTDWFNARGSDTIGLAGDDRPVTVGHVAVDVTNLDLALGKAVSDPADRALLLGTPSREHDALLARYRLAPIGGTRVVVVLVGSRGSARIVDMRPRVLARLPVSRGARLNIPRGGPVETVELGADLDRPVPRFAPKGKPDASYFAEHQVDLKRDERVTFSMTFRGEKACYEFDFVLTVQVSDHTEEVVIKAPDGGPFRLTGASDTYDSSYEHGELSRRGHRGSGV
ncbi:hypothetical protein [Nonomuraea sp. KM88]|uniref:hypothetical protein n=1 Tax=Nonomuraea sp. KM88 TaxID=3457427 RepID=UPI003FCE1923